MTRVLIDLRRPEKTGLVAASGRLEWRPTARRTQDDFVVLPAVFDVQLVGGVASVEVAPSEPGWVWRVSEYVAGSATRFVVVPDVPEIAYVDLVDVDPATLDPSMVPEAAWWAALREAALGVSAIVDPEDPEALILHFPSWQTDPADDLILFMPIQEA